ncbi:MAG: type II secretion system protein, partial [Fimbriimonas sp.]
MRAAWKRAAPRSGWQEKLRSAAKGFTLVEVMASVVLLGVGIMSVVSAYSAIA